MHQVGKIRQELIGKFPGLVASIDQPSGPNGSYFLDMQRPGRMPVVVEWRPDRGFGVSTLAEDDSDAFSGPDEVYPDRRSTADRLAELVSGGGSTEPPPAVRLAELRRGLGLSQVELAEKAEISQSSLAQLEARADAKVSTLSRIVAAMGASLSLHVVFPDGRSKVLDLGIGKEAADRS